MAVRARLDFDTVTGPDSERIDWRLDIVDENYVGTPLELIGNGNSPVVLDYHKDDDIYKPLQGSSMGINLWVPNASHILPDFNAGGAFDYEVLLQRREKPGSGARVTDAGGTALTFAAETGTRIADIFSSGQISVRINAGDKATTVPALDSSNVGRWVYVSNDGGATVVPIGTLRATEYTSATRIQLFDTKGYGSDSALDTALANYAVGDEVWLADAGDTGNSKSFTTGDFVPYWCGYINPIQSNERVTTFPFSVKFTATDRLGLLNQQSLVYANVLHDPSLIGYIGRALRQTGLELPIYIDSGIRTADGDALINAKASEFSFFDDDSTVGMLGDRATLKESLEGSLRTFGCKVYQSDAKWFITSCSLHGNATDTDTEYAQFIPDTGMTGRDSENRFPGDTGYVPTLNREDYIRADGADATVTIPSLRYEVNGSATEQLSILSQDLILSLREAWGSVEARPDSLFQDPLHPNTDFALSDDGWNATGSLDTTLNFDTNVYRTGGRSITTQRNRQVINASNEVWFRNTENFPIDPTSGTSITFDWRHDGGERDIRIPFRLRLILPTAVTYNSPVIGLASLGTESKTTDTFYYDFNLQKWEDNDIGQQYDLQKSNIFGKTTNRANAINTDLANGGDANTWQTAKLDLPASDSFYGLFDFVSLANATMEIEFFYPQSYRGDSGTRQNQDAVGEIQVWIDRVAVNDNFSEDTENPVYEYRQPRGTMTETYNPAFISSGPTTFRQFLNNLSGTPITNFWRKDETSVNGRSLENVITGNLLKDNKERLAVYEGMFINRTTTPISQHHKVNINYPSPDNGQNGLMTLNGGTFDVKQNMYDLAGYIADANTLDSNDVYTPFNVDLVAERFDGTRAANRYIVEVVARAIAVGSFEFNGVTYNNGDVISSGLIGINLINETKAKGEEHSIPIEIVPNSGLVTSGTPTLRADSENTPIPLNSTLRTDDGGNIAISRRTADFSQSDGGSGTQTVGGGYAVTLDVVQPSTPDFDELHIDIPVTRFNPEPAVGVEDVEITLSNLVTNTASIGNNIVSSASGPAGHRHLVEFTFSPADPSLHEVLPSDVLLTIAGLSDHFDTDNYIEQRVGNTTKISIPYEIPAGGETGVTIGFTGSASSISTVANPQFDFYAGIALQGSLSNVSLTGATVAHHRGSPTAVEKGQFFFKSDEGYFLIAENFSQIGTADGISNIQFNQVQDDTVEVTYDVTIGSANVASESSPRRFTIGSSNGVVLEPFSFTFIANNLGIAGGSVGFSGGRSTHRIGYNESTTTFDAFTLIVSPASGMAFEGTFTDGASDFTATSNEVSIDVNELSVINTATGGRITLNEGLVTVARNANFVTSSGQLVFDLDINPAFLPDTGGNYALDVNVTGASGLVQADGGGFGADNLESPLASTRLKTTFMGNGKNLSIRRISGTGTLTAEVDFEAADGGSGTVSFVTATRTTATTWVYGLYVGATGVTDGVGGTGGTELDRLTITQSADVEQVPSISAIPFAFEGDSGLNLQRWRVQIVPSTATATRTSSQLDFGSQTDTAWAASPNQGGSIIDGGLLTAVIDGLSESSRSTDIVLTHSDDPSVTLTLTAVAPGGLYYDNPRVQITSGAPSPSSPDGIYIQF